MRATSNDAEVALALGIPVGRIFGATWFLAGAYAALAGVFLSMFPSSVEPNLGYVALRAFPAVIVGGLESPAGTVIAGLALGLLEVLAQGYLNSRLGEYGHGFHTVFPYLVMIGFLMVRPYGIFGRPEVERL
jgi:branched-chain amino acid transport system permease protein